MLELVQNYLTQAPQFGWNAFWVSQGLIGLGLIFDIISFQFKSRKAILVCFSITALLISIHFLLLGVWVGALMAALSIGRFVTAIYSTDKRFMYGFYVLSLVGFVFTYQRVSDFLALGSNFFFTTAAFQLHDKRLRQLMMVGTSLWIIYNLFVFSPALVALESIFLTSNFVGYYRYYIRDAKT